MYALKFVFLLFVLGSFPLMAQEKFLKSMSLVSDPYQNVDSTSAYAFTKFLQTSYVKNPDGAVIRLFADTNSLILGQIPYASQVNVVEIQSDYFGLLMHVNCEYIQNGEIQQRSFMQKVFASKNSIGNISEIKVQKNELNLISYFYLGDSIEESDNYELINSFVEMELVPESEYLNACKQQKMLYNFDTLSTPKKNGILQLKCANGMAEFKDRANDQEDDILYEYEGQILGLDKYILNCTYWEDYGYKLVDKNDQTITDLIAFPHVSQDLKYVICLCINPYSVETDMTLYKIVGKKLEMVFSTTFTHWMLSEGNEEIVWSENGSVFVSVQHSKYISNYKGNADVKPQYLRINILRNK